VSACFLDLSKAFDLVNYDILQNKLLDSSGLLRYWYENQTNCMKSGDATSSDFRLDCGVRQGGLNSPAIFILYVDDQIGALSCSRIGCHMFYVSFCKYICRFFCILNNAICKRRRRRRGGGGGSQFSYVYLFFVTSFRYF
jgi:hypothetical protein